MQVKKLGVVVLVAINLAGPLTAAAHASPVGETGAARQAGKHAAAQQVTDQALKALRQMAQRVKPQAVPVGTQGEGAKKTAAAQPEQAASDGAEADGSSFDDVRLPMSLTRGPGYDQILDVALQDPIIAEALHAEAVRELMLARSRPKPDPNKLQSPMPAAAQEGDPSGGDAPAPGGGNGGGFNNDTATQSVLSLNNGPVLYQPPCPFGWPPPDRYGGLADIITLAPMAGDFISEAFAPAAAWQPMAELFGPLIAIIQPTIEPNRYWIDPTIINVRNPINAIHFLFFGWYDVWHRQKFLAEEVEWANEVAPWLQQVFQTPQAACFVAFEGMFQRLIETGQPWPRGWYVEDHATTWDIDKIGPYEPAVPGRRPYALQQLDQQLAIEDAQGEAQQQGDSAPRPQVPSDSAPPPVKSNGSSPPPAGHPDQASAPVERGSDAWPKGSFQEVGQGVQVR